MTGVTLKCTYPGGSAVLRTLTTESTLSDLQDVVQSVTSIAVGEQRLKSGFPPKPVSMDDPSVLLSEVGVRSGDNITVVKGEARTAAAVMKQGRTIKRHIVPANNSCLFASLGFLLQADGGDSMAASLRYVVASAIVGNPSDYPEVMLGKDPLSYAEWIQKSEVWGGGIELAVLTKHFTTEIHVVDTQSLRIDKFGQDHQCTDKVYVIYDGIHYDPLYEDTSRGAVTVFSVSDIEIENAALLVASQAKTAHNFTDLANFTLKCGSCGKGLKGENDARDHAKKTGHTNFEEYS